MNDERFATRRRHRALMRFQWAAVAVMIFAVIGCKTSRRQAPVWSAPHQEECSDCELVAIVGANVIPMTAPGRILYDQTVLIRDGRIESVRPRSEVIVTADRVEIDGRGHFLIPALADMHVHLEHFEDPALLDLFLNHGVTLVRNMDGRPGILEWREGIREGVQRGPEIVTAGPILDGDPPLLPDNSVIRGSADAREAVREQASAGYDFIKTYSNLSADAYRAVVASAREEGLRIAGHVPQDIELSELLRVQWSIEHLADYGEMVEADDSPFRERWHWSKLLVGIPIDEKKLRTLATQIAGSDTWVVPTLVQSARALADEETLEEWLSAPETNSVPDEWVEHWKRRVEDSTARMDEEDWDLVDAGYANRSLIISALHEAGSHIAVGTDTPNPFVIPGASIHEEMELLVEAGLTSYQALAAATTAAAAMVGKKDWGTIEEGNEADLILLRDNPLDDIRASRSIAGVVSNGRWNPVR